MAFRLTILITMMGCNIFFIAYVLSLYAEVPHPQEEWLVVLITSNFVITVFAVMCGGYIQREQIAYDKSKQRGSDKTVSS